MKQRFENRHNEFLCKQCGDSLSVTLADEIGLKKTGRSKRKLFCGKECAKKYKQEKKRGKDIRV